MGNSVKASKRQDTQKVALIGWPVEHSVSPAMHNAAFRALDLPWRYELLPTPPDRVAVTLDRLRSGEFRGANVTVPHKQAVIAHVDELTSSARGIGAVNTIVSRQGQLAGHNTDAEGFVMHLRAAGFEPAHSRVVVLGAGGAARAIVLGLSAAGAARVTVLNRTYQRAQALVADMHVQGQGKGAVGALPMEQSCLLDAAREADLMVNTTSVGMRPHDGRSIWPAGVSLPAHLTVYDLVYNPLETALLRQARASGARAVPGLGMLVYQGALSFDCWTGQQPPIDLMFQAARQGLPR
jgi:shikimate dehydrogenase